MVAGQGKLVEVRPQMGKQGSEIGGGVGWEHSRMAFRVMLKLPVAPVYRMEVEGRGMLPGWTHQKNSGRW